MIMLNGFGQYLAAGYAFVVVLKISDSYDKTLFRR